MLNPKIHFHQDFQMKLISIQIHHYNFKTKKQTLNYWPPSTGSSISQFQSPLNPLMAMHFIIQ